MVIAGIHAMEWIGVEVATALLSRLAGAVPRGLRIVAFPLVNVDGFAEVEADRRAGRRRFRRGNARGVDLNRNWPSFFRARTLASTVAPFVWRPGARAGSEPETAAVLRELDAITKTATIDKALSLHSYGKVVLYPYGGRWKAPERVDRLRDQAHQMCALMGERYRVHQVARWVPGAFAYGLEIDHLYTAYGADALLVECSGGGLSATKPRTYFDPWRWYNPEDPREVAAGLVPALERFVTSDRA